MTLQANELPLLSPISAADDRRRLVPGVISPVELPKPQAPAILNVFACLVHENLDCVIDLVRNLRHLDPSSTVLLYDGSSNGSLLDGTFAFDRYGAIVHPSPRRMQWGRLHDFALDCMRYALEHLPFDTLTIVDSDQLGLRPGYSVWLAEYLARESQVGMLSNSPEYQGPSTKIQPARIAHAEIELWRPFLRRFADGESKFVHWSFWPSTVFTADAARDLVKLFDVDPELMELMGKTRVWATEEIILPTLVALLGYRVVGNPCSYDFVRYRTPYSVQQLEGALKRPDVFWAHPIPRRFEDPLRKHVRNQFHDYAKSATGPAPTPASAVSLDPADRRADEANRGMARRRGSRFAHRGDGTRAACAARISGHCRVRKLLRPGNRRPGQRGQGH